MTSYHIANDIAFLYSDLVELCRLQILCFPFLTPKLSMDYGSWLYNSIMHGENSSDFKLNTPSKSHIHTTLTGVITL